MSDEPLKLKFGDVLAEERTAMAAERTLMAWVRTSLSLIGFGFTLFKFLQSLQTQGVATKMAANGPRNLGLFLMALGSFPLALAIVQHWRIMTHVGKSAKAVVFGPSFLLAVLVDLLGLTLFSTVMARIDLF